MNKNQTISVNIDPSIFNQTYIPHFLSTEQYKYNVFYGGSGSGKSNYIAHYLILDLLKNKKRLLVVRQTLATIRESAFKELVNVIEKMNLHNQKGTTITHSNLRITLPTGSEIIFRGADEESKLLSISDIDTVWVEEASEISYDIFTQLKLRLRGKGHKKRLFLSFNPISASHWLKKEFFDNKVDDCFVLKTTYLDNRFLDEEYHKVMDDMKNRNPDKYKVYALGEWGTTGKQVFTSWKVKKFNVHELIKSNPKLKTAIGGDFGFSLDPSTLICSLVDLENRKIYIFDELYEKGLMNNELAERIHDKGYHRQIIYFDSSEPKSIAELQMYGLSKVKAAVKGKGSIMQGIQFIQQFDIIVQPSCVNTIDELENYSFKRDKATGHYLNQPIDSFNHLLDALRYSMVQFQTKESRKMKVLPSSYLGI